MDPAWVCLEKRIRLQDSSIIHVEPRFVVGAGRGLFATRDLGAIETVISIPGEFLLNARTLSNVYPRRILPALLPMREAKSTHLTSIQLLSLHLYRVKRGVLDAVFDAYIATLPTSFSDHPLSVIQDPKLRQLTLGLMPVSVANLLLDVEKRLKEDWRIAIETLTTFPKLLPPKDTEGTQRPVSPPEDYIWAWLNVNTRCLYHDLKFLHSDDNVTMCPLLDFANHTSKASLSVTQDEFALADGMAFSTAGPLKCGDQVFLRYGGHSNAFLFAEYGFVLPIELQDTHITNGEITVDPDVEELFRGSVGCDTRAQLLKDRNYWRDWTLNVEDGDARPSYRLIPALRLLHITLDSMPSPGEKDSELALWEDSILGVVEAVSAENDAKVRESLDILCQQIIHRGKAKLPQVRSHAEDDVAKAERWHWMLKMIEQLWEEEQSVAESVQKAVLSGVEF